MLQVLDIISNKNEGKTIKELDPAANKNNEINHGMLMSFFEKPWLILVIKSIGSIQSVLDSFAVVATACDSSPNNELVATTDEVS